MLPGTGAVRSVGAVNGVAKRARFDISATCLKLTLVAETGWMRAEVMRLGAGAFVSTGASGFVCTGACGFVCVGACGFVFVVAAGHVFFVSTSSGSDGRTRVCGFDLSFAGRRTCARAREAARKSAGVVNARRSASRPSRPAAFGAGWRRSGAALKPFLFMLGAFDGGAFRNG